MCLLIALISIIFIGPASAASTDPQNGDNIIIYQYGAVNNSTIYYLIKDGFAVGSIKSDSTGTIIGNSIEPGMYCNQTNQNSSTKGLFTLNYPSVTLDAYLNGTGVSINKTIVTNDQSIDIIVNSNNNLAYGLEFITPSGGITNIINGNDYSIVTNSNISILKHVNMTDLSKGMWSIKLKYITDNTDGNLSIYTDSKYLNSNIVAYTVGEIGNTAIISSDKIIIGNAVLITITGKPTTIAEVTVGDNGFYLLDGQPNVNYTGISGFVTKFNVTIPDTSVVTIKLYTNTTSTVGNYIFTVKNSDTSTKLKCVIENGEITVDTKYSYTIGEQLTLTGINTESNNVYVFISGSNIDNQFLNTVTVNSDDNWKDEFYLSNEYDAGTYTIEVTSSVDNVLNPKFDTKYAYDITTIVLKQPELSVTDTTNIVVKGEKTYITGIATGTDSVMYYVFGTNTFVTSIVNVDDNIYTIELDTTNLDPGTYDIIVQHPMYDGYFNVGANQSTGDVLLNPIGNYNSGGSVQFNVFTRQTGNAEDALCALIDDPNIDDIYDKTDFDVINPLFTLNNVNNVYAGESFVVSGTTNLPIGDTITVQISSIAFDLTDKLNAESNINIIKTATTVFGKSINTWSVSFDTLPVGDYNIVATVTDKRDLTESTVSSIIVATQTTTPTINPTANPTAVPTATHSPGFGACLALVGFGAIAILILRRD